MKKLLIISFYFPPSAKPGAHRAISLAEYLPAFGWEPVFIAPPLNIYYGNPPRVDHDLLNLVEDYKTFRIPYVSPFNKNNNSLFMRAGRRIWEALFIPDSRVLWNVSIKKRLDDIISKAQPDAVYITAAPFSSFLLAPLIKNKYQLPIILDYRDPWTGNVFLNKTYIRKKTSLRQEKKAVAKADMITSASFYINDHVKKIHTEIKNNTTFFPMPYGFDKSKFSCKKGQDRQNRGKIVVSFAGSSLGDNSVEYILKGLKHACEENPGLISILEIHSFGTLFGKVANIKPLLLEYGLQNLILFKPYLPYEEFIEQLLRSDFLLLQHGDSHLSKSLYPEEFYIAKQLYPSKFFEYLGAKKPIIYVGTKGQVWDTITDLNAGVCLLPEVKSISDFFSNIHDFAQKEWYNDNEKYLKFSRSHIIGRFAKELDKLVSDSL